MNEDRFEHASAAGATSDRRTLIKVAGASAAAALLAAGAYRAGAQDATPAPAATGTELFDDTVVAPTSLGPAVPPEITQYAQDWPTYQGNLQATRVAAGSTIDSSNVATLGIAWNLPLPKAGFAGSITANPIIQGDTVYVQDMYSNVYALDRETGAINWQRTYDTACTAGPNGVSVGYGRLFGTTGSGSHAFALDAATGEELWSVQLTNNPREGLSVTPSIFDSTVYLSTMIAGRVGAPYGGGTKGIIYALSAETGETLWQWDTTSNNLWGQPRVNSGGCVWYPFSFDDDGHIYFGVGNPAPYPGTAAQPNGSSRPGENLYSNCMVSLRLDSGAIRWYVNGNPRDIFDLDFQNTPVVADVDINGVSTKVAIGSGKNGYVIAANADSGKELWRVPVGMHQNDDLAEFPLDTPVLVYPSANQGGIQTPLAYSDGMVYAPIVNLGQYTTGSAFGETEGVGTGQLVALDVTNGSVLWEVDFPYPADGGATISNDLVFTSTLDGILSAFNKQTGEQVFTWQGPAGINASPAIAGDMLIIPAGTVFIQDGAPAPQLNLIALKLGAAAKLVQATPEAEGASTPSASAENAIVIGFGDIFFTQTDVSIAANTDVAFHFENQGVLVHNFIIEGTDFATPDLSAGETADLVVNLPAGTYTYFCGVLGHREAGMVGTLTVAGA